MELAPSDYTFLASILGRGAVKAGEIPLIPSTRVDAARRLKSAGLVYCRRRGYYHISKKGIEIIEGQHVETEVSLPQPKPAPTPGKIPVPEGLDDLLRDMGIGPALSPRPPAPTFSWVRYILFWGAIAIAAAVLTALLTWPK